MPTATSLRNGVAALSTLASQQLGGLWRELVTAAQAREALADVLPGLLATYGAAAATLAADWYDELRAEADMTAQFTAIVADLDDLGGTTLARWGIEPLYDREPDWRRARTLIDGGVQLRIAKAARQTVMDSTAADPQALGWQRIGNGDCPFCELLIARGAVYTESTAQFAAHDHCQCEAMPAFGGRPLPVKAYTPTTRTITDADRARAREYLNEN